MGPDPVRSVSLEETRTQTHTECDHVSSQEDQPCSHLDLRLLASRGLRTHLSAVFTPAGGTWDGSHSRGRCEPMRPYSDPEAACLGPGQPTRQEPRIFLSFWLLFSCLQRDSAFQVIRKGKNRGFIPMWPYPLTLGFPE